MKNKDYILIWKMTIATVAFVCYFYYEFNEYQRENDNYIKSIEKELKTVKEHAQFMDSIHYSKCGFVLREGLDAVIE